METEYGFDDMSQEEIDQIVRQFHDGLDSMMGLDQLDLYYKAHVEEFYGETFHCSVYFENGVTDEKFDEADQAIGEFFRSYPDQDAYLGYIDVTQEDDKISIYLDLGNVKQGDDQIALTGILEALNNVSGIKSVIINEHCDYE